MRLSRRTRRGELPYKVLVVELKHGRGRERACSRGSSASPSPTAGSMPARIAFPRVLGGMGTAILSTSSGVITSRTAEREGVGGEVICFVW